MSLFNRKTNPWKEHCEDVKRQYPKLTLKERLKIAARTYKK